MDNELFTHVTCDYYTRHYEIAPKFTGGLQVTIYAECSPNTTGVSGNYYALNVFFSADEIPVRDHITGVYFGEGQMDKLHLDAAIDGLVDAIVSEEVFPEYLRDYMRKEEMWEEARNDEYLAGQNDDE